MGKLICFTRARATLVLTNVPMALDTTDEHDCVPSFVGDAMWTIQQVCDAIIYYQHTLPSSSGHSKGNCQVRLAQALLCQYLRLGNASDLEESADLCMDVISGCTDTPILSIMAKGIQGICYRLRFEQNGVAEDIDSSIKILREALAVALLESSMGHYLQTQLGCSLLARFAHLGETLNLEEALHLQNHVNEDMLDDSPHQDLYLHNLGQVYTALYTAKGGVEILSISKEKFTAALQLRPPGHRDRPDTLLGLFSTCQYEFEHSSRADSFQEFCDLSLEALALCPSGHPRRVEALSKRAASVVQQYDSTGGPTDLDEGINLARQTLDLCQGRHPHRSKALSDLASFLARRTDRYANRDDMDQLIRLDREALSLRQPGHPQRTMTILNLSLHLLERWELLGHESDLHEAVNLSRQNLALIPTGHRIHGYALFTLVNALLYNYTFKTNVEDLLEAIDHAELWLQDPANSTSIFYPTFASVAGDAYIDYYYHSKDKATLSEAIRVYSLAEASSIQGTVLSAALRDLSRALGVQYAQTSNIEDADRAFSVHLRAIEQLDPKDLEYPRLLCGAAHLHLLPGTTFYAPSLALDMLVNVIQNSQSRPRMILTSILDALDALEGLPEGEQKKLPPARLFEVYEYASALLPRIAYLGLDSRSRLRVLQRADSLGTRASIQAIQSEKVDRAVELLEETHAVFWTHHLRLKSSFNLLPHAMGDQLKALYLQIEAANENVSGTETNGDNTSQDRVTTQQHLVRQLEDLIQHIRTHPGLERFMMYDTFKTLSQAAASGPVVVLLQDGLRAYGLVMKAPGLATEIVAMHSVDCSLLLRLIECLKLEGLYTRSMSSSRGMRVAVATHVDPSQGLLDELWRRIMKPIIKALGMTVRFEPDDSSKDALISLTACFRSTASSNMDLSNRLVLPLAGACRRYVSQRQKHTKLCCELLRGLICSYRQCYRTSQGSSPAN